MRAQLVREWLHRIQVKRRKELLTGQEGFLLELCQDWLDRFAGTAVGGDQVTTVFVDLTGMAIAGETRRPDEALREMGVRYWGWESQPIADQLKLIGVDLDSLPDPCPDWLRISRFPEAM